MTRFHSDENLLVPTVDMLGDHGHHVLNSAQAGQANRAIPDREVLELANSQARAVPTFDRRDSVRAPIAPLE